MDNSLSSLTRLDISDDRSLENSTRDPLTNKYSCTRCGRSYLHQATLVRHQRYECGISASYPCQLCGRKFKRRDVLKGHMEKCLNKSNMTSTSPLLTTSSPLLTASTASLLSSVAGSGSLTAASSPLLAGGGGGSPRTTPISTIPPGFTGIMQ